MQSPSHPIHSPIPTAFKLPDIPYANVAAAVDSVCAQSSSISMPADGDVGTQHAIQRAGNFQPQQYGAGNRIDDAFLKAEIRKNTRLSAASPPVYGGLFFCPELAPPPLIPQSFWLKTRVRVIQ
jgi:hypothetical protein